MQNNDFILTLLLEQWNAKAKQLSALFEQLGEGSADNTISPGRNKVIYLLGHKVTYHHVMVEALGIGPRVFGDQDELFFSPQRDSNSYPPFEQLFADLQMINQKIAEGISTFGLSDWLSKHAYVSAEDFATQPHRNKLSILLSRTAHISHHYGQLLLAKPKA